MLGEEEGKKEKEKKRRESEEDDCVGGGAVRGGWLGGSTVDTARPDWWMQVHVHSKYRASRANLETRAPTSQNNSYALKAARAYLESQVGVQIVGKFCIVYQSSMTPIQRDSNLELT